MKTIINSTDYVIVVKNNFFEKEIPIGSSINIEESEFNNDYFLTINYFSFKKNRKENQFEIVRTIGNRLGFSFSSKMFIPMQTNVDIEKHEKIIAKSKQLHFKFLMNIFKTLSLEQIVIENIHNKKQLFSFVDPFNRKKVLFQFLLDLIISLPGLLISIGASCICCIQKWGWLSTIALLFLALFWTYNYIRKIYYLIYYIRSKN